MPPGTIPALLRAGRHARLPQDPPVIPATPASACLSALPPPHDPYPTYAAWRAAGPLHWNEALFGGAWVVTTQADVQAALRDPRLSSARTGGWVMRQAPRGSTERRELVAMQRLFARALLFVDDPAHARLRAAMQAGFRPERMAALRPFVEQAVAGLLDEVERTVAPAAPFDFIDAVARRLPAQVMRHLLGFDAVPGSFDAAAFAACSEQLARFLGTAQPTLDEARQARDALLALQQAFERLRCARAGMPTQADDLLGLLLAGRHSGAVADDAELFAQCAMLLFAGYETTRHLLGNGLLALLQSGGWAALQAQPARLRGAVRELLRWDSPVQYTGRRARTDFEWHGRRIARGQLVLPLIGAANRDPAAYDAPDRLQLDRAAGLPLSFGSGPHVCIGALLTLMEAECTFAALLQRWPALQLAGPAPRWLQLPLYRGLQALQVRRGAA